MDMGYQPVHLYASGTFQAFSSGGINKAALANPTGFPMEITAIKFQLLPASGDLTGASIGCRLDYQDQSCSNGFVPISMFCKSVNVMYEIGQYASTGVLNFVYRPSKPILIPPRGLLIPQFQHYGITKEDVTVGIGYSARAITAPGFKPKVQSLPYVACYRSKVMSTGQVASDAHQTDQSTETDLVNPFNEPLNVDRFVGRLNYTSQTNDVVTINELAVDNIPAHRLKVRMVDSFGEPVAGDFMPFGQVFSKLTRSWECPHVLNRKGYYLAYLDFAGEGVSPTSNAFMQAFVSMVGWRDIPYQKVV